ncbi:MAG: SMP-30/gluconolactonase/LRE family protein [Jatrophihabitans sp.]|uniref:SMP-30/gluconolactonase/LRE family protein n=1 Tax=Jatrophihabitans sp. TaxID=1932789 RepID=UPI003F80603A
MAHGRRTAHGIGIGIVSAVAALVLTAAAPATAGTPGGPNPPQPIAVLPAGSFPESVAVRDSAFYVSLGFAGSIVRVSLAGEVTTYASGLPIGSGLLTGLAFDRAGDLYVAVATLSDDPAPGVLVVPPGGGAARRVLTLPAGSFPNGLAVQGADLVVSDSDLGALWRFTPSASHTTLTTPWVSGGLLAPSKGLGPNGVAFDPTGHALYVAVSDSGRLVRVPLSASGAPLAPVLVTQQEQLRTIDGIAVDTEGNVVATVNRTNRLVRIDVASGRPTVLADRSDGLSYPTQPAFDGSTLVVTNGAFSNGVADVEAFPTAAQGLPLPR